ncbi:hypothetical protein [Veillonella sp. DNF00869]|jgi:hypothetical protein|uniref:hypothetical protein n=1 Tax=Veillonella sp. DNF00869 TaxID=1384081 RepID=UPI00078380B8|nr:hypothetical protein [Veillonella sp. DNF00869]KXB86725.1 hypothetical protein HMPREF3032_01410 [Veillonella sp. DNF00869]
MNEYDYTLDKTGFYKILFSTSLTVAKEQLQTALTPKKLAGAVEYMCMLCTCMNMAINHNQLESAKFNDGIVEEYVSLVDVIIRNEGSINYVQAVKIDELYMKSADLVRSLLEGVALTEQLRELQRSYRYWNMKQRMQSTCKTLLH